MGVKRLRSPHDGGTFDGATSTKRAKVASTIVGNFVQIPTAASKQNAIHSFFAPTKPPQGGVGKSDCATQAVTNDSGELASVVEHGEAVARHRQQREEHSVGTIRSLSMTNFMCHRNLTFTFGDGINFLTGHNGSGKSAALSALIVGLGGKAATSGRGSSLKSYIKGGERIATVTVALKNVGEDAFEHATYGDTIFVERQFTTGSRSSYRVLSADRKLVSRSRAMVDKITDHMNIQVDNPLNVLTQDGARRFLGSSSPRDKYLLFLEATQLADLARSYDAAEESLRFLERKVDVAKEALQELSQTCDEWSAKLSVFEHMEVMRAQLEELQWELAWAHLGAQREELQVQQGRLRQVKTECQASCEQLTVTQSECDAAKLAFAKAKLLADGLSDTDRVDLLDIRDSIYKLVQEQNDAKLQKTDLTRSLGVVHGQEARLVDIVARETAALELEANDKLGELVARSKAIRKNIECLQKQQVDARNAVASAMHDRECAIENQKTLADKLANLRLEQTQASQAVRFAEAAELDAVRNFGVKVPEVLDAMQRTQWPGEVPFGPVGLHVKMRPEFAQYASVLRRYMGEHLCGFVVSNAQAQRKLRGILRGLGVNHLVTIASRDIFSYKSGILDTNGHLPTIMDTLEISDERSRRVLIDSLRIEKTYLAPTRSDAERLVAFLNNIAPHQEHHILTADGFRVVHFEDGGHHNTTLRLLKSNDIRNLLLRPTEDTSQRMRELHRYLKTVDDELATLVEAPARCAEQLKSYTAAWNEANAARDRSRRQLGAEETKLARIEAEIEAVRPQNLSGSQEALDDARQEALKIESSLDSQSKREAEIDAELAALRRQEDQLSRRLHLHDTESLALQGRLASAKEEYDRKNKALQAIKKQNAVLVATVGTQQAVVGDIESTLQESVATVRECAEARDEVTDPRPIETLEPLIFVKQNALDLQEAHVNNGPSVDMIAIEAEKAHNKYKADKQVLQAMVTLVKVFKLSLAQRTKRWRAMRSAIAIRCKMLYLRNLSRRNYEGKLFFNHEQETLELYASPDREQKTTGATLERVLTARVRDPASLSGGEKSFATISLLLSLWDAIDCPIRCLDEFDVFMDAVNRGMSMKMMMEAAKTAKSKQFILLSPLDMSHVAIGDNVKILRMDDPQRRIADAS